MQPPRSRRFGIPNSRAGAVFLAVMLAVAGFSIGALLLLLIPMVRSGQRPGSAETRLRVSSQPQLPTAVPNLRPELWRTPVARQAFPSLAAHSSLSQTTGSVRVLYDPPRTRRVVPAPPIADALGRTRLTVVLSLDSDDDLLTPGPTRPDDSDPTRMVIAVKGNLENGLTGCTLAIRPDGLRVSALKGQVDERCQEGIIRVSGDVLRFAVLYDQLPNYHARDGAWRLGGAFGWTEVRLQLSDPPA